MVFLKNSHLQHVNRFLHAFINFFRHPIHASLIFYYVLLMKPPKANDIRHWLRLNRCAYSRRLNFFQRSEVFLQNHRFVCRHLRSEFLDDSRGGHWELWSQALNGNTLSIRLTTPSSFHRYEGELVLVFECNARRLMVLSFMFCDGRAMGAPGPVAFVTRIQGVPGQYDHIKLACKLLPHLNLSHALISALEGLCHVWGIEKIIGVNIENQLGYEGEIISPNFHSTYHNFWINNHAETTDSGYYLLNLPLLSEKKPLSTGSHRSRAIKRREIRSSIKFEASNNVRSIVVGDGLN